MAHFLDTYETISEGAALPHFGIVHLSELAVGLAVITLVCMCYHKTGADGRQRIRRMISLLLLIGELAKHIVLLSTGRWTPVYLPLHLCSINLFLLCFHSWRSSPILGQYLYCVCLPTAVIALLFPGWFDLPVWNFIHLHSLTVHILLALYPLLLVTGRELRRQPRLLPRCLLILVGLAVLATAANLLLDTNFMFLRFAPAGNPLQWFETSLGSHLIGYPILAAPVLCFLYLPLPAKKQRPD